MKKFKSAVVTIVVFSMVMGNAGLFRADFVGNGIGTERAAFVIAHDPNPGASAHDPNPGASRRDLNPGASRRALNPGTSAHDPNPGASAHDPNPGASTHDPKPEL